MELDPAPIRKKCHLSKGLPSRIAFDEWVDGLDGGKQPELDMTRVKAEGFGPESFQEDH